MNMKAAMTGEQTEDDLFQLTGISDLSPRGCEQRGEEDEGDDGWQAGSQAGFRVSKAVEVYVEPSAVIYCKDVEFKPVKHHPLEGEARLSIGTKYHF